jgi:hypothetical protein
VLDRELNTTQIERRQHSIEVIEEEGKLGSTGFY